MSKPIRFACPECSLQLQTSREYAGAITKCTCGKAIVVPELKPEQSFSVSQGVVGLGLTGLFLIGILIRPGGFETVMIGGVFALVGLILSIWGCLKNQGRIPGAIGILVFVLAWAYNASVVGRL